VAVPLLRLMAHVVKGKVVVPYLVLIMIQIHTCITHRELTLIQDLHYHSQSEGFFLIKSKTLILRNIHFDAYLSLFTMQGTCCQ